MVGSVSTRGDMCLQKASYDQYEHTIYLAKMAMKYSQNILEKYDDVKDEVWLTEQQYLYATNRMMKIYKRSEDNKRFLNLERNWKKIGQLNRNYIGLLTDLEREFQDLHTGTARAYYIHQEYKRIGEKALEKNGETTEVFKNCGLVKTNKQTGRIFGKGNEKEYRVDLETFEVYDGKDYVTDDYPTVIGKLDMDLAVIILLNGKKIELEIQED